jgi:hypothetical protein
MATGEDPAVPGSCHTVTPGLVESHDLSGIAVETTEVVDPSMG